MVPFAERLEHIKEGLAPLLQRRMIFLLNPKDTAILEAVVAWTVVPAKDITELQVAEDATLEDLWAAAEPDILAYATALGCTVSQALPRFNQLKSLNIIYPDGSVADQAITIINVYINTQINGLRAQNAKNASAAE
ncbi:MAG: hypothetical protein J5654_11275 [Victivallales bacterium]|nr:hypothetical protein [Victivallales bacterium]